MLPRIHVHQYSGFTTCVDGHSHGFSGVSGPAIYRPDGRLFSFDIIKTAGSLYQNQNALVNKRFDLAN